MKQWKIYFCLGLSLAGYLLFGYFLRRADFFLLAPAYLIVFASYFFLVSRSGNSGFSLLFAAAILFRLSFLFSVPSLSDDYFRFIWDGRMLNLYHNPYTVMPSTFIQHSNQVNELLEELYAGMNSPNYYTVYPPVCQYIFAFAAWWFPNNLIGSIVVLRAASIIAELGTLILMKKLLIHFQLPKTNLFWYALNPLVILELSGNIHFESVMIFFLLSAVWLLFASRPDRKSVV